MNCYVFSWHDISDWVSSVTGSTNQVEEVTPRSWWPPRLKGRRHLNWNVLTFSSPTLSLDQMLSDSVELMYATPEIETIASKLKCYDIYTYYSLDTVDRVQKPSRRNIYYLFRRVTKLLVIILKILVCFAKRLNT